MILVGWAQVVFFLYSKRCVVCGKDCYRLTKTDRVIIGIKIAFWLIVIAFLVYLLIKLIT